MTAEILIMNKRAVALAADSAQTSGTSEGPKIFMVNKLFTLSKYQPVGIMAYGNTQLNEVPWETIIKVLRKELGTRSFDRLKDYADAFVAFLGTSKTLFSETGQRRFLGYKVRAYFSAIRKEVDKEVAAVIEADGRISYQEVQDIVVDKVEAQYDDLAAADRLPSVDDACEEAIIQRYGEVIEKARADTFQDLPMPDALAERLRQIVGFVFSRDLFSGAGSGVVIAGFGDQEVFPSFIELIIDGVVNDAANYKEQASGATDDQISAVIRPFAQTEMVSGFMEGIEPDLSELLRRYLVTALSEYGKAVIDSLEGLTDNEKQVLGRKLNEFGQGILDDIAQGLQEHIQTAHVSPIVGTVATLPKDELASMAEALVGLTSFKRKVSMVAETVGGPIDVAVISKGDGFIWIKRKHYFKADLNQPFFANYFRDEQVKGGPR